MITSTVTRDTRNNESNAEPRPSGVAPNEVPIFATVAEPAIKITESASFQNTYRRFETVITNNRKTDNRKTTGMKPDEILNALRALQARETKCRAEGSIQSKDELVRFFVSR